MGASQSEDANGDAPEQNEEGMCDPCADGEQEEEQPPSGFCDGPRLCSLPAQDTEETLDPVTGQPLQRKPDASSGICCRGSDISGLLGFTDEKGEHRRVIFALIFDMFDKDK